MRALYAFAALLLAGCTSPKLPYATEAEVIADLGPPSKQSDDGPAHWISYNTFGTIQPAISVKPQPFVALHCQKHFKIIDGAVKDYQHFGAC